MNANFLKYTQHFKALSDEMRLKILAYLQENGEKCVCDIVEYFDIGQSAISYHLKILTDVNLINKKQIAVWNYYRINEEHEFFPLLQELFKNKGDE